MGRILLTGFGSYGEHDKNPSEKIAKALDGRKFGASETEVVTRILPVSAGRIRATLADHIDQIEPVAIIGMGLYPGTPMMRVERLAINFAEFDMPDNEGAIRSGQVDAEAADAIAATWPAERIAAGMRSAGIPARLSEHAGTYLCNTMLFHTLTILRELGLQASAGFLHVPYLPENVCNVIDTLKQERRLELYQRRDLASMSLELQLRAAEVAIEETLAVMSA